MIRLDLTASQWLFLLVEACAIRRGASERVQPSSRERDVCYTATRPRGGFAWTESCVSIEPRASSSADADAAVVASNVALRRDARHFQPQH